jgi:hypothetical protein
LTYQILVKDLDGKSTLIWVTSRTTEVELLGLVSANTGIPDEASIRFVYEGKQLPEGAVLSVHGVTKGGDGTAPPAVHMLTGLEGGMRTTSWPEIKQAWAKRRKEVEVARLAEEVARLAEVARLVTGGGSSGGGGSSSPALPSRSATGSAVAACVRRAIVSVLAACTAACSGVNTDDDEDELMVDPALLQIWRESAVACAAAVAPEGSPCPTSILPTGSRMMGLGDSEGRGQKRKAHAERDAAKEAKGEKDGLLVNRGDFRRDFGAQLMISGGRKDCLAHAVAHALGVDPHGVREGIGADHSFKRAVEYVDEAHPECALAKNTAAFMVKGGIELALLNAPAGHFVLSMSYMHEGVKRCAFKSLNPQHHAQPSRSHAAVLIAFNVSDLPLTITPTAGITAPTGTPGSTGSVRTSRATVCSTGAGCSRTTSPTCLCTSPCTRTGQARRRRGHSSRSRTR